MLTWENIVTFSLIVWDFAKVFARDKALHWCKLKWHEYRHLLNIKSTLILKIHIGIGCLLSDTCKCEAVYTMVFLYIYELTHCWFLRWRLVKVGLVPPMQTVGLLLCWVGEPWLSFFVLTLTASNCKHAEAIAIAGVSSLTQTHSQLPEPVVVSTLEQSPFHMLARTLSTDS